MTRLFLVALIVVVSCLLYVALMTLWHEWRHYRLWRRYNAFERELWRLSHQAAEDLHACQSERLR